MAGSSSDEDDDNDEQANAHDDEENVGKALERICSFKRNLKEQLAASSSNDDDNIAQEQEVATTIPSQVPTKSSSRQEPPTTMSPIVTAVPMRYPSPVPPIRFPCPLMAASSFDLPPAAEQRLWDNYYKRMAQPPEPLPHYTEDNFFQYP